MSPVLRASTLIVFAATLLGVTPLLLRAQTPAVVLAADALFADASAKEVAVRKALTTAEPPLTLLKAVRTVISDYEGVVRHYPSSGFCDDALWRAARLSRDAFEEFHEPRERATALRLLQLLASQYPSSRLARQVPEQVTWLNAQPAPLGAPSPALAAAVSPDSAPTVAPVRLGPLPPSAAPSTRPALTPNASSSVPGGATPPKPVSIKAIRRAVLSDVVRVVVELDGEVPFHDERIESPSRVFIDLPSTRAVPSLVDQTLRFDADTDVVRQIRIGRHPNSTTRVVLEASGVSSYSVYPLYSPFRLVIDCLREAPAAASGTALPASPPARHAGSTAVRTAAALPAMAAPPAPVVLPLLSAVPLSWMASLPAATSPALRDGPDPPSPAPTLTPLPPGEPSRNMTGGLSIARQLGLGVSRIVIDPGHGGHDPGAKGDGVTEAELVLDVSLRLEKLLAKLPGVEVVLTRRENEFITLQGRTAIANRESADLFLSIHANASNVPGARGVETYFLNFASNQSAAAVAAFENATSDQTMGALQDVVKAIALNSKLDESRDFATYVQREMLESLRGSNKTVKDLGVKQAPFVVLIGASMPSVLAEISFITNPQEAKLLKGGSYRQRIAQALFDAVKGYQSSLKRAPAVAQQQN